MAATLRSMRSTLQTGILWTRTDTLSDEREESRKARRVPENLQNDDRFNECQHLALSCFSGILQPGIILIYQLCVWDFSIRYCSRSSPENPNSCTTARSAICWWVNLSSPSTQSRCWHWDSAFGKCLHWKSLLCIIVNSCQDPPPIHLYASLLLQSPFLSWWIFMPLFISLSISATVKLSYQGCRGP